MIDTNGPHFILGAILILSDGIPDERSVNNIHFSFQIVEGAD